MAKTAVKKDQQRSIIGQQRIRDSLAESVRSDRTAHAYLLTGSRGIGKAAIALEFARLLLCQSSGPKPCEECEQCRLSLTLQHPDLHLVFPVPPQKKGAKKDDQDETEENDVNWLAEQQNILVSKLVDDPYHPIIIENKKEKKTNQKSNTQSSTIRVEHIKWVLKQASLKAFQSMRKVFIIFHADNMNETAQAKFLKVLEEPPESVVFLLATDNEDGLKLTIRSRCQRVAIPPLTAAEIAEALIADGIPAEAAKTAAHLAGGSFTHARELASGNLEALQTRTIDFFRAAAMCDPLKLPEATETFLETEGLPSETTLELLAMLLRDVALCRSQERNSSISLTFQSFQKSIEGIVAAFPQANLEEAAKALDESAGYLARGYTENYVLYGLAIRLRQHLGPRASTKRKTPAHA
ncbi:MAG: ATP-binding protein [Calditrichota bacterium]